MAVCNGYRAHRGEFGDLVLIAPPRFLGMLRELFSNLLDRMIVKTVDQDLTAVKPHELRKVLEEVLPAL